MKNNLIRVTQITILTILVTASSLNYGTYLNNKDDSVSVEVANQEIRAVFSKNEIAVSSYNSGEMNLLSLSKNLNDFDDRSTNGIVLGDSIMSVPNGNYFNDFNKIVFENKNGKIKTYPTNLDGFVVDLINSDRIEISNVYATDDYYHSLANVMLESTINYKINSSIISQIKDGKRTDILVDEKILALSYDEENDIYYYFYKPIQADNSVLTRSSKLHINSVTKDSDTGDYIIGTDPKEVDMMVSTKSELISSNVENNEIVLVHSSYESGKDTQTETFVATSYNIKNNEFTNEKVIVTKSYDNGSRLDVVDFIVDGDYIFLFLSDLSYSKILKSDFSTTEYIITNSGKVNEVAFDISNSKIYMLASTDDEIKLFSVVDGEGLLLSKEEKQKLGFTLSNLYHLYDFSYTKTEEEETENI